MVSKKISALITALFLLTILGAMAYVDSYQAKNPAISTFQIGAPMDEDETVSNEPNENVTQMPEFENRLVNTFEDDGYLVETYREYEVYKDQNGNVMKSVPTSNYSYLRYKEKL